MSPHKPLAFAGSWKSGVWWVRVFGYGVCLKAPRNLPLFSERYGHHKTILRVGGWRLLRLDR